MTSEALADLIKKVRSEKSEGQHLECKAAAGGTPKRLFDTLSSFSNQNDGGVILFGIDEENEFTVCGVYNAHDLQAKVVDQGKQMEPMVHPLFTTLEIDGKIIVSAEIAGIDVTKRPCFYKGTGRLKGSWTRIGDADLQMTEYEVYSYAVYKQNAHDDLLVADRAETDDIDSALLDNYLIKLKLSKPKLASLPREEILKLQGIVINGKPTLAGILIFGKFPQAFYPQLSITAMVAFGNNAFEYSGSETRFIDNQRIEGTIPEMLDLALSFVRRNMRVSTVVDFKTAKRKDKEEYPLVAVRELVLNSLVHRDYSVHTTASPIRLIIYRDRLELENPGGLYGRLTIDELGKAVADTRNEFIAGILEILIGSENRFTGIPTVRGVMRENGLPEPEFSNRRGQFKVILRNATAAVSTEQETRNT
jgi:ATP-dependent DNA helicase RecG